MLSGSYLWEFKLSDATVGREAWCTDKVYQPLGRDRLNYQVDYLDLHLENLTGLTVQPFVAPVVLGEHVSNIGKAFLRSGESITVVSLPFDALIIKK